MEIDNYIIILGFVNITYFRNFTGYLWFTNDPRFTIITGIMNFDTIIKFVEEAIQFRKNMNQERA